MNKRDDFINTMDQMVESATWQLQIHPWLEKEFYTLFLQQWNSYFDQYQKTSSWARNSGLSSLEIYGQDFQDSLQDDLKNLGLSLGSGEPLWSIEQLFVFTQYATTQVDPVAIFAVKTYFDRLVASLKNDSFSLLKDQYGEDSCQFIFNYSEYVKSELKQDISFVDSCDEKQLNLLTRTLKATNYNFLMSLITINETVKNAC